MSRLDFDAINAALNAADVVPAWLPDGKRNGHEWIARNPTRNDKTIGSFAINLNTGKWADFASGDEGGDLVSLYAYLFHNRDNAKAARELSQNHRITITPEARQQAQDKIAEIKDHQPQIVLPAPADAPAPNFTHYKHGDPSMVWPYYDTQARLLMFVCRFDTENGKEVVPLSWCEHPNKSARWTWRGVTGTAKRPIYGQDRLAAMPDADVLVVEGEKTADAAQQIMGDHCAVISWLGGTSTADKVALHHLRGRRVVLWPDFDSKKDKQTGDYLPLRDQPGIKAMLNIARGLAGIAREVLMVGYTVAGKFPDTWDLADAAAQGWELSNVMQYMGLHAGDPFQVAGCIESSSDNNEQDSNNEQISASEQPQQQDSAPALPLSANVNPFGFPHLSDKGKPLNTVENLVYMLEQYGITAKYNQISKTVEVIIPNKNYSNDNGANCALAEITSLCARNQLPKTDLDQYIKLIADANTYNPVADWIDSVAWDGVSRIDQLCDTVRSDMDHELKNALILRWLLSAVAAIYKPRGFSSHGVLVFTGQQGVGKTSWFKRLVPESLRVTLDGAIVDPSNKDTIINVIAHWLVELGELDATFRKADIARLKAFVTMSEDKLRLPYDRQASSYQRRTVFFASVNEDRYLVDDTGNRRWWTIPVTSVNYDHDIDLQQVWAELAHLYRNGAQWWLTQDEQAKLNGVNEDHESIDPVEELIRKTFDWSRPCAVDMTASDVLIAIGYDRPNKSQATHASKVLQKITGEKPRKTKNGRFFQLPVMTAARNNDNDRPY